MLMILTIVALFVFGQLDAGIPGVTPDSAHEYKAWAHVANEQNELRRLRTGDGDAGTTQPPPAPPDKWVRRDATGNLISDGTYFYQYDAWDRLIQVNLVVQTAATPGAPAPGEPAPLPGENTFTIKPGLLVKHFSYDGLGRLVRAQSPWPNVQEGPVTKKVRSERFFYDGIRRIQELVTDPVLSTGGALMSEDPGLVALAEAEGAIAPEGGAGGAGQNLADGDATSLKLEEGQVAAAGAAGGGAPPPGSPPADFVTYLAREYIWGPGDAFAGSDELLVQFERDRWAWWVLQDASGDVVAVCDMGGVDPGEGGGNAARVCGQWRYDAYGAATAAEHLASFPQLHCGHPPARPSSLTDWMSVWGGAAEPQTARRG